MKNIIKTILAILLVITLASSLTAFARTPEESAQDLAKYNIMNGFPDGSLRLENRVTRAQMAKMVVTALGRDKIDPYASADVSMFRDMEKTHWAYACVSEAYMCRLISGFPGSTFRPDENVTYEQALKIVVCALRYDNYKLQKSTFGTELKYPDEYIEIAKDLGLTEGAPADLKQPATRGFIATLISKALDIPYVAGFVTPETADKPIMEKEFVYEILDGKGQGKFTTLRTNLEAHVITRW